MGQKYYNDCVRSRFRIWCLRWIRIRFSNFSGYGSRSGLNFSGSGCRSGFSPWIPQKKQKKFRKTSKSYLLEENLKIYGPSKNEKCNNFQFLTKIIIKKMERQRGVWIRSRKNHRSGSGLSWEVGSGSGQYQTGSKNLCVMIKLSKATRAMRSHTG